MAQDWQGLEKKLAAGKTLQTAAIECGIDLAFAEEYAKGRLKQSILDDVGLIESASVALQVGLQKLIDIANAPPMLKNVTESEGSKEDGDFVSTSKTFEATDLDAAKALVKYAVDVRKLVGTKSGVGGKTGYPDLFDSQKGDSAEVIQGPWLLRKVE